MDQGAAEVGMRVAHNAKAKRTTGIGYCYAKMAPHGAGRHYHHGIGTITKIDDRNHLGSQVVTVKWDDGCECAMSPDWLHSVGRHGGYRHGKRSDLQNTTEST
jgi:hypothetical protein